MQECPSLMNTVVRGLRKGIAGENKPSKCHRHGPGRLETEHDPEGLS